MIDIDSLIARDQIEVEPHKLEHDFSDVLYRNGENYQGFQLLLRQTMQHPILSKKQEQEYFSVIQNGADNASKLEARNQIIIHNQKLVLSIAMRYRGRGMELEDLIQEGNLGLIVVIASFLATDNHDNQTPRHPDARRLKLAHGVNVLDLNILDPGAYGLANLIVSVICRDLFIKSKIQEIFFQMK